MRLMATAFLFGYAFLNTWSGGWYLAGQAQAASPATEYPSKPLRWIVASSASGGSDSLARMYGQKVAEVLRHSVVIDNRGGASGMIGMELAAIAAPDGYTVVVISVGHLIRALLSRGIGFDLIKTFAPVSLLATAPTVIVIHPSLNARTLQEFIALARSQPGKINYASGGIGGVQHLATEMLKREAKIDLVHVPYKGTGPALVDLLAGQVQVYLTNISNALPHAKSGKLRLLAVSSAKRLPQAPDLPTFAELGLSGITVGIWYGMLAPARTPSAIVDKLSQTIATVARMPDIREKMSAQDTDLVASTPVEFGVLLRSEMEKWSKVVRDVDIHIE